MSRPRIAVVGAGALGRHHARILSQLPTAELVAVADINPEIGKAVAADCHTRWIADYRELFDQLDAVSIVVPTTLHRRIAAQFLTQRIPVLVEKPITANVAEAQELVELAENNDTLLQVGHIERFNPAMAAARPLCPSPRYVRAERLSPYAFRSTDIGVVLDLMIHDLDLILDWVDSPVTRVEAFGLSILGEHEDSVQARIGFENGCIADLTASRVNPTARRAMQAWSTDASVTIDFAKREVTGYRPSETLLYGASPLKRAQQPNADVEQLKKDVFGKFLKIERPTISDDDALTAELSDFLNCVVNNRLPRVDGRQALRAMQLAGQILDSVATHQWDATAEGPVGPFAQTPDTQKRAG